MSNQPARAQQVDAVAFGKAAAAETVARFEGLLRHPVIGPIVGEKFAEDAATIAALRPFEGFLLRRKAALDDAERYSSRKRAWLARLEAVPSMTDLALNRLVRRG